MKKTVVMALLAISVLSLQAGVARIISRSAGSITFEVDGELAPVEEPYMTLCDGNTVAQSMLRTENIPQESFRIVSTSFAHERQLRIEGKDAFYQTLVDAYARHRSVAISPDMIWLLISQGFARYVNARPEQLRSSLISHSGKIDLVVESGSDLLSGQADWPVLIDEIASLIDKYTEGNIAKTITADFSTTSAVERVASQITLMESVKSYFEYIVVYLGCGIPSITLKGTPDDWRCVLEKTRKLNDYGLKDWVKKLEPVLTEFVRAAEGQPEQSFWQEIVKKQRTKSLKGGACSPEKPTRLDGWMLYFFPDENGVTRKDVAYNENMPSEYVRIGFKYRVFDSLQGTVVSETPMELWAGFIGAEMDTIGNVLCPKIGWLVRIADTEENLLEELKTKDQKWGIELRVKEVPEILSKMRHIKRLNLEFIDDVVLPEWLDRLSIDEFRIKGKMTKAEKEAIVKRFPQANVLIQEP